MITRIEIDGFKTFQNFSLDLAPFQVIIGPNGCGKSNLFDAMRLLSKLAKMDLNAAFRDLRGDPLEQFTLQTDGSFGNKMRFAVELLVDRTVTDDWGTEVRLGVSRLRYQIEIINNSNAGTGQELAISYESLQDIPSRTDSWVTQFASHIAGRRLAGDEESGEVPTAYIGTITIDGVPLGVYPMRRIQESPKRVSTKPGKRSLLSRVDSCDLPEVLAVGQDLRNWRLFNPSPMELRKANTLLDEPHLSTIGSNLAVTLSRLKSRDPFLLQDVSRDLANLVPNIKSVDVDEDRARDVVSVLATAMDGRRFNARLLSDGTLRALALATMKNHPEHRGTLCFEDPEEGVHPSALKRMVSTLRAMTTDLSDPEQDERLLRQMLVTTHSPEMLGQLRLDAGELLFAESVSLLKPGEKAAQVTRMTPVRLTDLDDPEKYYALSRVVEYLNNPAMDMRSELKEALLR